MRISLPSLNYLSAGAISCVLLSGCGALWGAPYAETLQLNRSVACGGTEVPLYSESGETVHIVFPSRIHATYLPDSAVVEQGVENRLTVRPSSFLPGSGEYMTVYVYDGTCRFRLFPAAPHHPPDHSVTVKSVTAPDGQTTAHWLYKPATLSDIERQLRTIAVPPSLADAWAVFRAKSRSGDQVWLFSSPPASWSQGSGKSGYALVREGNVVAELFLGDGEHP